MRAFVAVEVGDPFGSAARDRGDRAPAHLTLRFLGEVAEDRGPAIEAVLGPAAAAVAPFDLTLEGVGAFPSKTTPHVVWVGATAGRERLAELHARISDGLASVGFPPDAHEFLPHVTLFRVRSPSGRRRARLLLEGVEPPPAPTTVPVAEVVLKESALTPAGPVHRTRGRFPLLGDSTRAR